SDDRPIRHGQSRTVLALRRVGIPSLAGSNVPSCDGSKQGIEIADDGKGRAVARDDASVPAANYIRVLNVDDDARFGMAVTALLESSGLTVVGYASNGAEGVALAEAARPSVVTMDLDMPVMNGVEATAVIVAMGIPVVI